MTLKFCHLYSFNVILILFFWSETENFCHWVSEEGIVAHVH